MLSKFSVKKPMTVIVAVLLVLVLGIVSFTMMSTDLLPSIDLPYVAIMTTYPGANPEKVELSVTKPLEEALSTIGGVHQVTSVSQENSSMVILEFEYGTNMDTAVIDISGKLDLVKAQMDDAVGAPILMKVNPDMLPILVASVDVDGQGVLETSQMVEETVIPALERVGGVASVDAMGLVERELHITLDEDKIQGLNDRILASVNGELANTQQKLTDARTELERQKGAISSAQGQGASLGDASNQILDGKVQAQSGLNALTVTEPQLRTQLEELKTQKGQLEEVIAAKAELPGLESQIATTQQQVTDLAAQLADPAAEMAGLMAQRTQLQSELDALPDTPENADRRAELTLQLQTLQGQIDLLQPTIDGLQGQLTPLQTTLAELMARRTQINLALSAQGNPTDEQLQGLLTQVEGGITACQQAIDALPGQKQALEQALSTLGNKQRQIEQGRSALNLATTQGTVGLALAEQQLEEQERQFETARDEALKSANLDGAITRSMVANILKAENFSMPAGYISEDGEQYAVKVGDAFQAVDEIQQLELFTVDVDDIGVIRLSDVATVETTDNAGEMYAKINGNDGVLLSFQKQSTASTAEVSTAIRAAMADLQDQYPDMHLTALTDQGVYIDIVIHSVLNNLLLGAVLAILILLFFLRNLKPTFIVAISIPISLLLAVTLMYFTGVSLNVISLAGLALGVGMLVDNSIVVIENIYRLRAEGVSAVQAAVRGAVQVAGAITASTLTTVCVFLPIVFTEGISRELFTDMGLTIAYSLLASLLIALTLVPALSSTLLHKVEAKPQKWFDRFTQRYGQMLSWSLRHRAVVLTLAVVLLAVSVFGATVMGTAFMPETDSQQISVTLEMPADATRAETRAMADDLLALIDGMPDVQTVGALQSGADNQAMLYVLLREDRTLTSSQVAQEITDATQDLPCTVTTSSSTMDISAMSGSGIEVEIQGDDLDTLQAVAREVAALVADTEGTLDVSDGLEQNALETRIAVDKNKALSYGLTVAQVYQEVAAAIQSEETATTLTLADADYPVIVLDDPQSTLTRETLADHTWTVTQNGEEKTVKLSDVASLTQAEGLSSIRHDDHARTLSVTAAIDAEHNIGLVSRDLEAKLRDYTPPDGYTVRLTGENETIQDTLSQLVKMVLLAILLIYLIMVAQFQSLLSPFIVMFTLPLAFTGGLLLLWACGFELSAIAMLGFLVLAGVVVNNGIVFVDYTNQLRADGMDRRQALVETGQRRIRPILMTALTTILALVTLAFGMGEGADMLQPMAVVIIGGLTYATLLTLFVVPCMYDIFQRKAVKVVQIEET